MCRPIDEINEIVDSEMVKSLTQERDALLEALRETLIAGNMLDNDRIAREERMAWREVRKKYSSMFFVPKKEQPS